MPELTKKPNLLWMKDITSYPLMGPFCSSLIIMVSMKVLITRSCIFLIILASDFSPLTVIVNATMFSHAQHCLFLFRYIRFVLI